MCLQGKIYTCFVTRNREIETGTPGRINHTQAKRFQERLLYTIKSILDTTQERPTLQTSAHMGTRALRSTTIADVTPRLRTRSPGCTAFVGFSLFQSWTAPARIAWRFIPINATWSSIPLQYCGSSCDGCQYVPVWGPL